MEPTPEPGEDGEYEQMTASNLAEDLTVVLKDFFTRLQNHGGIDNLPRVIECMGNAIRDHRGKVSFESEILLTRLLLDISNL